MILDDLYRDLKQRIAALDVRVLLGFALDLSPEEFLLQKGRTLTDAEKQKIENLISQRANGKPVAKIIGKKEFYGLEFITTTDTLDPRPDSETLIEAVLKKTEKNKTIRILDLGTGTGCLLLTLLHELPNTQGVAADISDKALEIARQNAVKLNMLSRATFVQSNWFENIAGEFDVVISNPPYIATAEIDTLATDVRDFDPRGALDGGPDGLAPYRVILDGIGAFLTKGGLLAFEVGHTQAGPVADMLKNKGFGGVEIHPDLAGINRIVIGFRL